MRVITFPPVSTADENGLLAVGGDYQVDTLFSAYRQGIFPWPLSEDFPIAWFSPDPRGVLYVENLHLSKSFQKWLKHHPYQISFNQHFSEVMKGCQQIPRKGQTSTWITSDLIKGYKAFFDHGHAFSVEIKKEDELVAGLFGVNIGEFISGESMFTLEDNASKLAIYSLLQILTKNKLRFLDTQMITPIVETFGGTYISRHQFMEELKTLNWDKRLDWELS